MHLVFVAKYRRHVFTQVSADFEAELVEVDTEQDPVPLLVTYPPKMAGPPLVNSRKGVSSRLIRKKNSPTIIQAFWGELRVSSDCAGSCGGAPLSIIRQYIEPQQTPD